MRIQINRKEEEAIENRLRENNEDEFEFINQKIMLLDLDYYLIIKVKRIGVKE